MAESRVRSVAPDMLYILLMVWSSEGAFVRSFAAHVSRSRSHSCVWTEIPTSYGQPDVVVAEYDYARAFRRAESTRQAPALTKLGAEILSFATHYGSLERDYARAAFAITKPEWEETVELLRLRNLANARNGKLLAVRWRETFVIDSLSIYEAKLSDWRRAIEQARRHLWLTASCFALVPSLRPEILSIARRRCKQLGIGLVLFPGAEEVVHTARGAGYTAITPVTFLLNERIVDNVRRGSRVSPNKRRD